MLVGLEFAYHSIFKLFSSVSCGKRQPSTSNPDELVSASSACLSARSGSLDEITGSLYTLIATNMAMAVIALILGLKPTPEISFHE